MKKFVILAAMLALAACCGSPQKDTDGLTGIEAISQDGTASILLPDETFMPDDEGTNHMGFDSEKGYIYVEWGNLNIEEANGPLPKSKEEVAALYDDVDADITVKEFYCGKEKKYKVYTSSVEVKNYLNESSEEPENFTVLEYVAAYEDKYYYASADVYDTDSEEIILKSLKTFSGTQ